MAGFKRENPERVEEIRKFLGPEDEAALRGHHASIVKQVADYEKKYFQ